MADYTVEHYKVDTGTWISYGRSGGGHVPLEASDKATAIAALGIPRNRFAGE